MFALRRAAARAAFTQPTRQLSTIRPVSRISQFQSEKATLYRSFHQSRRWLAEEERKQHGEASPAEAETTSETVTTEPSEAGAVESARQSASSAAETAQEKARETAQNAQTTTGNIVEQAQEYAANAASAVQRAASSAAQTVSEQFPPRHSGASAQGQRSAGPGRILYIGNLRFEATQSELEAEFARHGEITNSRVVTDSRGLSRGFGYIEFSTQEAADIAVREMDQKPFQGRRMAVQHHVRRERRGDNRPSKPRNPPSKTLFIGNMSYEMSDKDLNDLFKNIRDVIDVRVAIDRRSGQPRGFAHADFVDVASAERAKETLEQKVVYGRQLRIDFSASTRSDEPSTGSA